MNMDAEIGCALFKFARFFHHAILNRIVHLIDDDRARSGGALLPLEAECTDDNPICRCFEIGGFVYPNRTLPPPLPPPPLGPHLSPRHFSRAFKQMGATTFRSPQVTK